MQNDIYQTQAQNCFLNTYARYPITLERGEGAYVWDINNKKYLDFLSGIGCTTLGHNHPEITQAIIEQAQKILHTSNLYYSPPSIKLAQLLIASGGLDKIFFCNSGTEANEAAIKLARKYQWDRGNREQNIILSANDSFHGRTLGSLAATAKPKLHEGFQPLPLGFRYESWQNIDKFCAAIDNAVAAVILEPIQGEGGINIAPPGLLAAVRTACDKVGALLIYDEIQCGLGRTGKLFAYQYFGVKPDIITLGKGIANGLPLGAVCAQKQVAAFKPGDHGTTFGGNPVSCSAALASLEILLSQNYLERIKALSIYLLEGLMHLQKEFPKQIESIRGTGLMLGVELGEKPQEILRSCQEGGLLINITAENILRMLPPFIINEADIDFAIDILRASIKKAI